MAATNLPGRLTAVEKRDVARERDAEGSVECVDFGFVEDMAGGEAGPVDVEHAFDIRRAASRMHDRRALMEAQDRARCFCHQRRSEFARLRHSIEKGRLVE